VSESLTVLYGRNYALGRTELSDAASGDPISRYGIYFR